ncbi:unnamed protein product [Polarella glacialis]|uniref:Ubiquitin-like domain-containing protein n=1 Tax=Polarella glacialis TaxID=89957 RepID=A0A813I2B7_POLGL|nr:unnamed protein product [Polarella glacialis]
MALMTLDVRTLAGSVVASVSAETADSVASVLLRLGSSSSAGVRHWLAHDGKVLPAEATLASCGLKDGDVVCLVTAHRAPAQLSLNHNELGAVGLHALAANLPRRCLLSLLDLRGCGLEGIEGGEAVGSALRAAPHLEELKLASNHGLGPRGVTRVAQVLSGLSASCLKSIEISSCGLQGVEGGKAVASLASAAPALEELGLFGNSKLGPSGIAAAVESMTGLHLIQLLNVGFCGFSGSAGGRALAGAILAMPSLKKVRASGNQSLCAAGIDSMLKCLSIQSVGLVDLELEGCGLSGLEGGAALARLLLHCSKIEKLSLSDNIGLGSEGVCGFSSGLLASTCLKSLQLGRANLVSSDGGTAVASVLGKATALQELSLLGNDGLGAAGMQALASQWPSANFMTLLDLSLCGIFTVAGAQALAEVLNKCPCLEILSLSSNELRACGLRELQACLSGPLRLKAFHVEHCGLAGADGGLALVELIVGRMPVLCELGLLCNADFGEAGVHELAHGLLSGALELLSVLGVENCGLSGESGGKAAAELVKAMPGLEDLGLSSNELGAAGLAAFARALPLEPALRWLQLEDCGLEAEEGGRAAALLVRAAPFLEHLVLANNELLGIAGVVAMLEELRGAGGSLRLGSLNLDSCGLGSSDRDGAALGAALGVLLTP